jgi:uncharacterized protein YbaP (TraB family)
VDSFIVELTEAWRNGNEELFMQFFFEVFRDWPELAPLLQRTIYDRNRTMLQRILPFCERPGVTFAVIGSGHLVGPQGIPALMKELGYAVEKY